MWLAAVERRTKNSGLNISFVSKILCLVLFGHFYIGFLYTFTLAILKNAICKFNAYIMKNK
jgi:hypothetical protein